jgi:hypothetical protein
MELEALGESDTDAQMWIEVDLGGIMRVIPKDLLKARIQRVSDLEMAGIKTGVESAAPAGA